MLIELEGGKLLSRSFPPRIFILTNYIPLHREHTLGGLAQGYVSLQVGVAVEIFARLGEGGGHQVAVLTHIGETEGEAAALSDRGVARKGEEVAGTAQLEILLGYLEAVVGVTHGLKPLLGGVAEASLCSADEYAVGLFLSASDSSAQLMELGESEALGVFNYHKAGARHVDSDLDDGGGDQYLHLARGEAAHYVILVRGLHFAVNECYIISAESFGELLGVLHRRL